jgi:voltage-gated sodium channel
VTASVVEEPDYEELRTGHDHENETLEALLPPKEKSGLAGLIEGTTWNLALGAVVVLSALVIGFETDYMARHWTEASPHSFKVLDQVFCVFFTGELVIRIGVERFSFFSGRDRWWNWFDFVVVGLQLFEVISDLMHVTQNKTVAGLSNLRVVRVVRIVRLGRVFHLVPSLRRLLTSISETIGHIGWPLMLILLVTYLYGVVFTQIVTDHKKLISEEQFEEQEKLQEFYGSLDKSMLTLFETVSEGIHWGEVLNPLSEFCSPWLTLLFICYIGFVLFAMMNVITAFFVESAMEAAAMEHRNALATQLWAIFGKHHNHEITSEEFYGQHDHPQMMQFYEELKVTHEAAQDGKLFEILDADGSGSVDVDELIGGCQRLLGPAKQVDFAMFLKFYHEEVKLARQHREFVEAIFWGMKPVGPPITARPTQSEPRWS